MSRRHRSRVLEDTPQALRRTFTLREFARLLDHVDLASLPLDPADPSARARALVPAVLAVRGTVPAVEAADDAVPDPISGGAEAHVEATGAIDVAVRRILDAMVPPPPPYRPTVPAPRAPRRLVTLTAIPGPPPP